MKISEIVLLGGLAIFAGITLYASTGMPFSSEQTFGPGFLPLIMSVAVLVIGGLIAIRVLTNKHAGLPEAPGAETITGVRTVIIAAGLIAATIFLAEFGSLLAPLAVSLLIVTGVLLERGWKVAILSTFVTIAAIYAIFHLWLNIPLT